MRTRVLLPFSLSVLMSAVACQDTTVEQDMEAYCECVKRHQSSLDDECVGMANNIVQKYEFDAEASEYIQKSIKGCGEE